MQKNWQLTDLIDLEYFFQMDQNTSPEALDQRDRHIFLKHLQPQAAGKEQRQSLIMGWLQRRRVMERQSREEQTFLPGEAFAEVYRLLWGLMMAIGFCCGVSLTLSLLAYKGSEPLNVAVYFGWLVLTQVLLLALLGLLTPMRLQQRFTAHRRSFVYSLLSGISIKATMKLKAASLKQLSQSQKEGFKAVVGLVRRQKAVYGPLFFWPLFILSQTCAVAFNLGVLLTTLVRVLSSDLAFGWQSTLQVSPQAVYKMVQIVASPWRWFIPSPVGYPSLDQIEGSKLILKEGIYHLHTQDLVSWWPFLLLAVLFYGLLPRAFLLAASLWTCRRRLRRLSFNTVDCDRLMTRLITPVVTTQGQPQAPSPPQSPPMPAAEQVSEPAQGQKTRRLPPDGLVALIPDDIYADCPDDTLHGFIHARLGYVLAEKIRVEGNWQSDRQAMEDLRDLEWDDHRPKVLILQEAWQPPIMEILIYIQELRKWLGREAKIMMLLIGLPADGTIFTAVSSENWRVWQQKIDQLADPYLRLERIGPQA